MRIEGADNEAQVRAAHRTTLEALTTKELAQLLIACGARHDEDDWFRELIVDEIKRRKPEGNVPSDPLACGKETPTMSERPWFVRGACKACGVAYTDDTLPSDVAIIHLGCLPQARPRLVYGHLDHDEETAEELRNMRARTIEECAGIMDFLGDNVLATSDLARAGWVMCADEGASLIRALAKGKP